MARTKKQCSVFHRECGRSELAKSREWNRRWDTEAIDNVIGVHNEKGGQTTNGYSNPSEGESSEERITKQDINEFGATIVMLNAIRDNNRAQAHFAENAN